MLIYDVLHKETVYHSVVSELRNYGVRYRFKKNLFKTERLEGIKQITKKIFKTPLSYQSLDVVNLSSGGIVHVPVFVSQASAFLKQHATQEGLFRKAGSQLRQKELIIRLDNGGSLGEKHHAVDVANCLKTFFRDLPEPLIPYAYHDLFIHCTMLKTYHVEALLLACILLPPHHLNTLAFFMEFLQQISLYENQNKMSIDNLAKVIGPNIMPLQETTMSAMQMRLELHLIVVKILIENAENIGVLPAHITQTISMETIGSTDNELNISDNNSRFKSRKKKHRSGSLTRKPHLSASNLNLRMFNGLRKIVGKGVSEEGNVLDNQQVPENCDPLHVSNNKYTKKRKVAERMDPSNTKKKRVIDKSDRSKKLRLSLDRFVLRKSKAVDEDPESYTNVFDTCTERRWSSVSNTCDSQRKYKTYSNDSSQLKLILKDSEVTNELQKEYNNLFIDADVNLSDDSDEQVLLTKVDDINIRKCSSSDKLKELDNFSYPLRKKLTLNNFKTYLHTRHIEVSSMNDQSEEYVTISKSEYEDIKNRVSAIESRLSQEFACVDNEKNVSLSPPSVKKVQTAYEKTLEEASIENTTSTDYLARKLGKELKIRRSGEHKIIRSPSARKIGNLRRRSQERVMSKRIRRTASWHISHGSDLHTRIPSDQELSNSYHHKEDTSSSNCKNTEIYFKPVSTSLWKEEKNNIILNNVCEEYNGINTYPAKHSLTSLETEILQPINSRTHATVRRVSSFHGNELMNTANIFSDENEKLKKTNSQQNIVCNKPTTGTLIPNLDCKKSAMSWKDAEGYFKSTNQTNTPVTQTGRASIAKLRTQNAGMVLAKAKLFDECTTKIYTQNTEPNRKYNWSNINDNQYSSDLKLCSETTDIRRKSNKNVKHKNTKLLCKNSPSRVTMETDSSPLSQYDGKSYTSQNSEIIINTPRLITNMQINGLSNAVCCKKKNVTVKTPSILEQTPINTILDDSKLSVCKPDGNLLCRTPHIKKPLTTKTPKSARTLVKRHVVDSRRTPLKAVGQLGTVKYQSPKGILKTPRSIRYA